MWYTNLLIFLACLISVTGGAILGNLLTKIKIVIALKKINDETRTKIEDLKTDNGEHIAFNQGVIDGRLTVTDQIINLIKSK